MFHLEPSSSFHFLSARIDPLFITYQSYPYPSNALMALHITCLDLAWAPLIQSIPSYLHAHDMIRGITGYGAGHGPFIVIHDGFAGLANWAGFLQNSDRIALDVHPYLAFNGASHSAPIIAVAGSQPGGTWATQACGWGSDVNTRYGFSARLGRTKH